MNFPYQLCDRLDPARNISIGECTSRAEPARPSTRVDAETGALVPVERWTTSSSDCPAIEGARVDGPDDGRRVLADLAVRARSLSASERRSDGRERQRRAQMT